MDTVVTEAVEGDLEVEVTQGIDGPGSSVWTFQGVDIDTGDLIIFGADRRPAEALWDALVNDEVPVALVPSWAILSREEGE